MRKTTQTLIMAAAMMSFVITGCSENDLVENAPQNKAVTLTTTISLDGSSATTRALDADGKNTFAAGEQIALVYEDANNGVQKIISAKLKAENISSDKKKATLTFAFDKAPKAGGNFTMIYPASMAKEPLPTSGEFGDIASPDYTGLATQDGTLESLSSKLDLAYCESTFTSDATLPGGISLTNQLAILELSIKDYTGTSDLNGGITGLTVKVGTGASAPTYTVSRTAADGPIYVALESCDSKDITIIATTSTANYEKTVTSQSLAANTITPVTAKMWKVVELSQFTTGEYTAKNGEMLKGTLGGNVKISIDAGAAVALKDANINMKDDGTAQWPDGSYAGITCKGDATIVLEGTNKVHGFGNGYPGIYVASNNSDSDYTLTIQGKGSLEAKGRDHGAGIGGAKDVACGNIKIEGGTITATGGYFGAGIGSGMSDFATSSCGNITISGGTITSVQGGAASAGIGSGHNGKCGAITISGGTIASAKGGNVGAGIGSGYQGTCGDITITNGATITKAQGGSGGAAGIGSGYQGTFGNLTISGGTIELAQGGSGGAGIGSGGYTTSTTSTITISGGTITSAQGGDYGAGIGSGDSGKCGAITISGGEIKDATGGTGGAGIGSGYQGTCGDITITTGATITKAQGGNAGAGIGSGWAGTCSAITITTGVTRVTATKGTDALNSIGKGYSTSACGTVTIGCTLDGSGNPVGGTTGEISESPYTYQPVSQ